MHSFKDSKNNFWVIDLSVGAMRRVRSTLDIDLTQPQALVEGLALSQRLMTDVWTFVDVLFALCGPTCTERNLSDEQFAELLGGGVVGDARNAFFDEWHDFFQNSGRTELAAAIRKTIAMTKAVSDEAIAQLDRLEKELIEEATEVMSKAGDRALKDALNQLTSGD